MTLFSDTTVLIRVFPSCIYTPRVDAGHHDGRRLDFPTKVQTASKVFSVILHAFGLARSPLGSSPHLMLSEQSSMKDSKYQELFSQKRLMLFNALNLMWNTLGALVQNIEAMLMDPNASRHISSQKTPSLLKLEESPYSLPSGTHASS